MFIPCDAATSAFQYVTPSQPHTGPSWPLVFTGRLTQVPPPAAQSVTLQYSSESQSFEPGLHPGPPSGFPLVPELPELPDVPDVPDVPDAPDVPDVPDVPEAPDVPPLVPEEEAVFVPDELAEPPPKSSVSVAPPHEAKQATTTNAEPSNEVSRT